MATARIPQPTAEDPVKVIRGITKSTSRTSVSACCALSMGRERNR